MKYAEQLRAQTGVNTIYLATDSEDVLRDTADFPEYKFLTWREAHALPKKLKKVSESPLHVALPWSFLHGAPFHGAP